MIPGDVFYLKLNFDSETDLAEGRTLYANIFDGSTAKIIIPSGYSRLEIICCYDAYIPVSAELTIMGTDIESVFLDNPDIVIIMDRSPKFRTFFCPELSPEQSQVLPNETKTIVTTYIDPNCVLPPIDKLSCDGTITSYPENILDVSYEYCSDKSPPLTLKTVNCSSGTAGVLPKFLNTLIVSVSDKILVTDGKLRESCPYLKKLVISDGISYNYTDNFHGSNFDPYAKFQPPAKIHQFNLENIPRTIEYLEIDCQLELNNFDFSVFADLDTIIIPDCNFIPPNSLDNLVLNLPKKSDLWKNYGLFSDFFSKISSINKLYVPCMVEQLSDAICGDCIIETLQITFRTINFDILTIPIDAVIVNTGTLDDNFDLILTSDIDTTS